MKKEMTEKELRKFGLTLAAVLTLLGVVNIFTGHPVTRSAFFALAAFVATGALAAPQLLRQLYHVLEALGHAIGWLNTRIILIVVYYLILAPIGILTRIFGKDPMFRKLDRGSESYWVKRDAAVATRETLERQF